MDDKLNQTGEHPVSGTDQAQNNGSTEAPTEAAPQGEGAASAENQAPLSAASTPEAAEADPIPEAAVTEAAPERTADATPQESAEGSDSASAEVSGPEDAHAAEHARNLGGLGTAVIAGVAGAAALGIAAAFGANRSGAADNSAADENDEAAGAAEAVPESSAGVDTEIDTAVEPAADSVAPSESAAESEPATPAPAAPTFEADDTETMTMEQVMAASDEQLARKPIHRGMLTTGTVIMLSQDGLVVDVGQKVEGLVPYNQLFEFETNAEDAAKYFKSGDELQVYAIRVDIPNSTIILSKKRADQERAWNLLQDIFDKKLPVEVEIVEKVRGGLVANLGVRAFLPASQVDVRRINDLSPYVGQRMRVRIIELNRRRNRVIISRRSIMEEELAGQKEETLKKLEPGAKLEGEVVEITDFGAFVNLGGIDGLVHRSEITHGRFNHPREVLEVGQKVQVEVLDMDKLMRSRSRSMSRTST